MQDRFFGSKLNTVLLVVLIILMAFAIKIMLKNKELYFPYLPFNQEEVEISSDLVSFSVAPNSKVKGFVAFQGVIKGAYFFEANILVNILDANKKILREGHAMATDDWMTVGPVSFEGKLDFNGLPKGEAFIQIHNDNASGLPEHNKFILIPVVIE